MSTIRTQVNKVCEVRASAGQRVKSLKELSWTKANVLLSTTYGQKALHGVDSGATYAMQLLDHYLPPVGPQEEVGSTLVVSAHEDPALHTIQTVGRLSSVAARRVWANLALKVNELRTNGIELDPRRYIAALLAALHLAKVTSQAQQKETEEEKTQEKDITEPPVTSPPENTENPSAPTTTKKVKTTPEGKSKSKGKNAN